MERDWEVIHEFDITRKKLFGLGDFMRITQFRNSAFRVAKSTVVMEKELAKREGSAHAVTTVVVDESLNPFLE